MTNPLPSAAFMLTLSLLFAPALAGCSSAQTQQVQAVQSRSVARAAYASAAIGLKALGEIHYAWQKAQTVPTRETIDLDARILATLDAGKGALDVAKPWLENGSAGDATKEKLLEALDMALLAATSLGNAGGKVPPEVTEALMAARALLGGAS